MARTKPNKIIVASVLDRLSAGLQSTGRLEISVRELKQMILRDIEWLLNSRRFIDEGRLQKLDESRRSILAYGMPDLSTYSRNNPSDIKDVCECIKDILKSYEPRLIQRTVDVDHIKSENVDDFTLHFRIQGTVHVDPIIEPISFDTFMELNTGSVNIMGYE